jgi:ribosomal protein S18 acetylase RimI-like enzyme
MKYLYLKGMSASQDELNYIKSIDCEYVVIDVFAYNNLAINFYNKQGYHSRGLIDIKKL